MSSKLSLKDRIMKTGSMIFVSLLVLLIIIAFGMPNVIDLPGLDDTLAGRVNNKEISIVQVQRMVPQFKERLQQSGRYFPGITQDMLKRGALEQIINQFLMLQLADKINIAPESSDDLAGVVLDYLKRNYSQFSKGKDDYDFDKFMKKMTLAGGKYGDVERDAIDSYKINKLQSLMRYANGNSIYSGIEDQRLAQTKVSLDLIVLNQNDKEKVLKKRIKISKKEIKDKFKKEYANKPLPKVNLDPLKPELKPKKQKKVKFTKFLAKEIRKKIFDQKKSKEEAKFKNELRELSKTKTIKEIAKKYQLATHQVKNAALNKEVKIDINKKPESLTALINHASFRTQAFKTKKNQVIGPIETSGKIYLYAVKNRKFSKMPSSKELATKDDLKETLGKKSLQKINASAKQINSTDQLAALENMYGIIKKQATIKRNLK